VVAKGATTYWTATSENAWDHITGESFYGSIAGSHQDYASTGQAYKLSWTGKDKFLYGYDSFGNRISQSHSTNVRPPSGLRPPSPRCAGEGNATSAQR
jgi:hypothetical protein